MLFNYTMCYLPTQFIKKYVIEIRNLSVSVNFCSIIKLT